jgi:tetratricopeptide (TPR) repeat protein
MDLRRNVVVVCLVVLAAALFFVLFGERKEEPLRVVEPGQPLPMDETVRLRFHDGETGAEETWTVRKQQVSPEERSGRPLPDPDPRALSHVPDESTRTLEGIALESWKRGEIAEAMEVLERAIENDPDAAGPRTHYGRLKMLAMAYGDALPHLERAAELRPDDPQVWLDLATYYERKLIFEQSWEARRRAESLAAGRSISQDERSGFWVVEGESIYP